MTLCYRGDKFDRIKPDNHDLLAAAQAQGTLTVRLKTAPKSITAEQVRLAGPEGEIELANDYLLVCIGGELPTAWLAKIGVAVKTMHGEAHPALKGA